MFQRLYAFRKQCFWNSVDCQDTSREAGICKILIVDPFDKDHIGEFVGSTQVCRLVFILVQTSIGTL